MESALCPKKNNDVPRCLLLLLLLTRRLCVSMCTCDDGRLLFCGGGGGNRVYRARSAFFGEENPKVVESCEIISKPSARGI